MALRGDRLKELREQRGYTQEEIADRVGVAYQQIWRWETGKNDPTGDFIDRLAALLETSSDYLLGRVDDPASQIRESDLTDDERRLIHAYRGGRLHELIRLVADIKQVQNEAGIASPEPTVDS